jgi:hypothetical protein
MPYRCPKCVNTFKTIHLYNRHAASATDCGVDQIVIARPQQQATKRELDVKPSLQEAKRVKKEEDDVVVLEQTRGAAPGQGAARRQQPAARMAFLQSARVACQHCPGR